MAQKTWKDLRQVLVDVSGSNEVHYQPPESIKLKYPCIIFNLEAIDTNKANNAKYLYHKRYFVQYITRTVDDPVVMKILELPMCNFDRTYATNGLIHNVFTLYF